MVEVAGQVDAIQATNSRQLPPALEIHVAQYDGSSFTSGQRVQHVCGYPLFGRLRRDANVDSLIGKEKQPEIQRSVEMTLVPEEVSNYNDIIVAM